MDIETKVKLTLRVDTKIQTHSGAVSYSCTTWVGANPCQLFECRASAAVFLVRYGRKISETA